MRAFYYRHKVLMQRFVLVSSPFMFPLVAHAAGEGTTTGSFTDIVTGMLSWFLASFTKLTTWILADPMAATFASIFLVGAAVAMLFRILHSV